MTAVAAEVLADTPSVGTPPAKASLRARALVKVARAAIRPVGSRLRATPGRLAMLDVTLEAIIAVPTWPLTRHIRVERVDVELTDGWVRGEWVVAPNCDPDSAPLLYLHGGGYVLCSPRTHRVLTSKLAAMTGRPVFVLDYRLAPKHPYPAALDDARLAYEWLGWSSGGKPVAVAGDSAGGHLALCLVREAQLRGLAEVAAVVAFSPLVDLSCDLAKQHDEICREPVLPLIGLQQVAEMYLGGIEADDDRITLLDSDLSDFPPILLQVGGSEFLAEEVRQLGSRLIDQGVACQLEVWPEQIHVFQAFWPLLPESSVALRTAAEFLSSALNSSTHLGDAS